VPNNFLFYLLFHPRYQKSHHLKKGVYATHVAVEVIEFGADRSRVFSDARNHQLRLQVGI
jgi:hypothetical protein